MQGNSLVTLKRDDDQAIVGILTLTPVSQWFTFGHSSWTWHQCTAPRPLPLLEDTQTQFFTGQFMRRAHNTS